MLKSPYFLLLPLPLTFATPAGAVTSAELYRPAAHAFGKFEARIQFAAGDGVISSFFLWKDGSEQSTVFWNELDFEKLGAACELQTNTIYGLPQTNHEGRGYALAGLCDRYHTYAYEWTPEYIAWLVDGIEIRRETGESAAAYAENATGGMQFRFNVWPGDASFGGDFSEAILPVYQYVAWAQYSEYTPGEGDDGTDFTLAWREEFDAAPTGWQKGSWESPLGNSRHSSQNVVFVDGIAVLALTADDATGYSGTPPSDDAGAAGSPATGGAGGAPAPSTGGAAPPSTGGVTPFGVDDGDGDGCGCRLALGPTRRAGALTLLVGAALGLMVRRRAGATDPRPSTHGARESCSPRRRAGE